MHIVGPRLGNHGHLTHGARVGGVVSAVDAQFLEALDVIGQRAGLRAVRRDVANAVNREFRLVAPAAIESDGCGNRAGLSHAGYER